MSSSRPARCGNRSEIVVPASPCRRNLRDEPSSVPGLRTFSSGSLSRMGIGLPWCLASSILGSNVSTWLTPPYMKSTMHALALAGKCGVLGAIAPAADDSLRRKRRPIARRSPSSASRVASAVPTKPPADSQRNSRRVLSARCERPWPCRSLPMFPFISIEFPRRSFPAIACQLL